MLLDRARFSFTKELERHYPVFRRELETLSTEEFIVWPAVAAYTGTWRVFPFIEHCAPDGFHVDLQANRARCPETAKTLLALPRVRGAAFSRLDPGSAILPHADKPVRGVLRTHLGLRIPTLARLILDGEAHCWREGELMLFDGQIEHGTINSSSEPRDVLIVDMELTDAEREYAGIA